MKHFLLMKSEEEYLPDEQRSFLHSYMNSVQHTQKPNFVLPHSKNEESQDWLLKFNGFVIF